MTEAKRRSYAPLWALIAVTMLPFAAAWIVYFNPSLLGEMQTSNRGELVTPPRPVPAMTLDILSGESFRSGDLQGNWTLVSVAGSDCDRDCEINLYHMRQIRLAMGEERSRILRLLVLEDDQSTDALAARLEPYAGTIVITGPAAMRDQLLDFLSPGEDTASNRIFLIDPQGSLMMVYPPAPKAKDVVKDLERLISVVQM